MKIIDLASGTPNLPTLLDMASADNLILRAADVREYILAEVDDFDREVALMRQNQELMEFLEHRPRPSQTYSIDEARKILEID